MTQEAQLGQGGVHKAWRGWKAGGGGVLVAVKVEAEKGEVFIALISCQIWRGKYLKGLVDLLVSICYIQKLNGYGFTR